jgi:hypothetical protein
LKDKFGVVSCKLDGHRALRFDRERIASFAEKYEYRDYKILCKFKDSKDSSDDSRRCVANAGDIHSFNNKSNEPPTHILELSKPSLDTISNIFQETHENIIKVIDTPHVISNSEGGSVNIVNFRNNLYSQGIVSRLVGLESQKSIQNAESSI